MIATSSPRQIPSLLLRLAILLGGAASASLAPAARAAAPFRLDRIAIVAFFDAGPTQLRVQHAILEVDGRLTPRQSAIIDRPANTPAWALGRELVRADAWLGYHSLGTDALANFTLEDGSVRFRIGEVDYHFVSIAGGARSATGQLINISTRARLATGTDAIIGGFVVHQRDQYVLVRVVGPTLAAYGVTDAAPDPALSLKRGTQTIRVNDNWSTHASAADVRTAAARVGAFPLTEGSKDAARLLRLEPGIYSLVAEASVHNRTGGTVLLEVYGVPDAEDYELVATDDPE